MKKPIWQALVLSAMIILSACAQKTEEATAEPVEEKEVPMSAEPAEPMMRPPKLPLRMPKSKKGNNKLLTWLNCLAILITQPNMYHGREVI